MENKYIKLNQMKLILYLILSTSFLCCYSQDTYRQKVFFNELNNFVDSAKENSIKNGLYNVYVANIYNLDESDNYCFTFGYIYNFYDFDYVSVSYYMTIDEEILLVNFNNTSEEFIKKWNFRKIDSKLKPLVLKKLTPNGIVITGISEGLVICHNDSNLEKKIFENSDLIPVEKSIWKNIPQGGEIKLIKQED